jgi:hypothetical protein
VDTGAILIGIWLTSIPKIVVTTGSYLGTLKVRVNVVVRMVDEYPIAASLYNPSPDPLHTFIIGFTSGTFPIVISGKCHPVASLKVNPGDDFVHYWSPNAEKEFFVPVTEL